MSGSWVLGSRGWVFRVEVGGFLSLCFVIIIHRATFLGWLWAVNFRRAGKLSLYMGALLHGSNVKASVSEGLFVRRSRWSSDLLRGPAVRD